MVNSIFNNADELIPAYSTPQEAATKGSLREMSTNKFVRAIGGGQSLESQNAKSWNNFIEGSATPAIRALGEKGMLTQQDVQRALNFLPKTGNETIIERKNAKEAMTEFLKAKISIWIASQPETIKKDIKSMSVEDLQKNISTMSDEELQSYLEEE